MCDQACEMSLRACALLIKHKEHCKARPTYLSALHMIKSVLKGRGNHTDA